MERELQKRILSSIILVPLSFFFIVKGSYFFIFFLIITFFATGFEWLRMSKSVTLKTAGFIFLFFSFLFAYHLRTEQGYKIFLFVILISDL